MRRALHVARVLLARVLCLVLRRHRSASSFVRIRSVRPGFRPISRYVCRHGCGGWMPATKGASRHA